MAKPTRTRRKHPPRGGPSDRAGIAAEPLRRATPAPLARPATLHWLWAVFAAALALVVLANFFIHPHGHFGIDGSFAFFAWFGFLACIAVIVVAKVLGVFLRRDADYYRQGLDLGDDLPPGRNWDDRQPGDQRSGGGQG